MKTVDYLVIGGGIIGINIALSLKRSDKASSVCVIDKEAHLGMHGSGRNSGVIHSGFYYTKNTRKARFTRDGNMALKAFIRQKKLPLNECGKLVVAKDETELPILDTLLSRGQVNGVELYKVSEKEAREIEPRVKTVQSALWSPSTATSDPLRVLEAFRREAEQQGIRLMMSEAFQRCDGNRVWSSSEAFEAGYVVNAAGLYADRIAKAYGFGKNYMIFPFKGIYLKSEEPPGSFRTNIYPVPDLRNPFLGVHVTVTVDGHLKIGPTAIPAFWREQYQGGENFAWNELWEVLINGAQMMIHSDFDFRRLAYEELRKYQRSHLVKLSQGLAKGLCVDGFRHWGVAGIRAQLLDLKSKSLEMDFVYEGDERSFHVLNSVSPGWTCSIPFSDYLVAQMLQMRRS